MAEGIAKVYYSRLTFFLLSTKSDHPLLALDLILTTLPSGALWNYA